MPTQVPQQIQRFRIQKGYSQRGLAEKAGISAAGLSQIESGQTSPSVATLEKLANALGIPIISLFSEQEDTEYVVEVLRLASRPALHARQGAWIIPMGSRRYPSLFEPVLIRLEPGGEMSERPFGVGGSVEFVWVHRGHAVLIYEGDEITMREAESVYYDPNKSHNWRNPFNDWCELLLVRSL